VAFIARICTKLINSERCKEVNFYAKFRINQRRNLESRVDNHLHPLSKL
jgi:hypothetical protein